MIKKAVFASLLIAFSTTTHAAETAWIDVGFDTRVRLVSSDVLRNGKTNIALEVDMPANTKTYWRIPGETGIPTQIKLDGSENISDHEIVWPYPMRDDKGGYVDFVYYGPTVLPMVLDVTGDIAGLKMEAFLGVCDEICVPVQVDFDLPLTFDNPDRGNDLRIKQAINQAPISWDKGAEPFGDIIFDPEIGRLTIEIDPSTINPATLIVDNGDPTLLFAMPQKSPDARVIAFNILGRDKDRDLQGKPVRLTFLTDEGAYEMSRVVKPAP